MDRRKEMIFDKKRDNRVMKSIDAIKTLSLTSEKCNKEGKEGFDIDNDDSNRTILPSDREYIVFSFREDGSFDVLDSNSSRTDYFTTVDEKSRPVSRKLDYDEGARQVSKQQIENNISNSKKHHTHQHDQVYMTNFQEGETKESINLSPTQRKDNMRRTWKTEEEIEDGRLVSMDSRNSNQSEGSRGSFAFPKLAWDELVGSPEKMPKSEDMHIKKHKIKRCVRFQCFRF